MALALNNLKRVDMPLNKETKPTKLDTSGINIRVISWATKDFDSLNPFAQYKSDRLSSFFNGISIFIGYLIPKPFLYSGI